MLEDTQISEEQIIKEFLCPVSLDDSSQLLTEIKSNEHFYEICQYFDLIGECGNISADPDYIGMRIAEAEDENIEELESAVDTLRQKQFQMDCLITEVKNKREWIAKKTNNIESRKELLEEDCEVLAHQNSNLTQQIKSNGKLERDKSLQSELKQLLLKYRCEKGFPKNKTSALQLLNNLDIEIQKLEIQKLSS